jgi:hypothetical protein
VSTIQRTLRLLQQNGLLVEQPPTSTDEAPICSIHQKPMKKGQYGWYCPRRLEDAAIVESGEQDEADS